MTYTYEPDRTWSTMLVTINAKTGYTHEEMTYQELLGLRLLTKEEYKKEQHNYRKVHRSIYGNLNE